MRSRYLPLAAMAFVVACADTPTTPLLQPDAANLALDGRAPPPWALLDGVITTDGEASFSISGDDGSVLMSHEVAGSARYSAWLLVTPGSQAALLRFTEGPLGYATFSNGAMISKVNGKVSGRGTVTVDGDVYDLSAVTDFTVSRDCMVTAGDHGAQCVTFNDGPDGSFRSDASFWTGTLSNDGGGDFDLPPGWDWCRRGGCGCINCVDGGSFGTEIGSYDTKKKGR